MRRREFITLIGSAATWPLVAGAQQPARPVFGILLVFSEEAGRTFTEPLRAYMQALGYVEGTHVRYDWRYGNGQPDLIVGIARELRRDAPDVIVSFSTICVNALKDEGAGAPVVMVAVDDPLRAGFVQDMSRPGMNFTGMTTNVVTQAPRLVELLHEVVPRSGLIGMLASPHCRPRGSS